MRIRLLLAMSFLFCCIAININAQSKTYKQPLTVINYNKNVNTPLTSEELNQIQEVYGNKANEYVLSKPQRLRDVKNILRNRVKVVVFTNPKNQKECKTLSQVSLFNIYNKSLTRGVFNKLNFNPLKYNFEFYSRGTSMYRVDNTDYFIIIKSQYQN